GGVESMTMVPMTGFHLSASPELMDKLPGANTPMGITAENVAKRFQIARQQQDEFAYKSQMKAKRALETGAFKDEIVPVRAVGYASPTTRSMSTAARPRSAIRWAAPEPS